MQNLPSDFLFLVLFLFVFAFLIRKQLTAFIKDLVCVGEDYWSWTTQAGNIYEDAEIEKIENDHLVLRHRFGTVSLPVEELSETSRQMLFGMPQWTSHLSSAPAESRITPFIPDRFIATQAA